MRLLTTVAAVCCALFPSGAAAYADTVTTFTLTSGSDVVTASVPTGASFTVQKFGASGVQYVYAVPFTLDGVVYSPTGPEQAVVVAGENFNRPEYTFTVQYTSYATGTAQDVVLYEGFGPAFYSDFFGAPEFAPGTYTFPAGDYRYDNTDHLTFGDTLVVTQGPAPVSAVPEPGALALVGTGLVGAVGVRRRRG